MLIEPVPVADIYADNIEVENLGTCFRVISFTYGRIGGSVERIVVNKVVRPISSARPDLFKKLTSGLLVPTTPDLVLQ